MAVQFAQPDQAGRFAEWIQTEADDPAFAALRAAETTGRPLASADFVADLEKPIGPAHSPPRPATKAPDPG